MHETMNRVSIVTTFKFCSKLNVMNTFTVEALVLIALAANTFAVHKKALEAASLDLNHYAFSVTSKSWGLHPSKLTPPYQPKMYKTVHNEINTISLRSSSKLNMINILIVRVLVLISLAAYGLAVNQILETASLGLSHFTFSAIRKRNLKENMLFSPLSIEIGVGMLLKGAGGNTAKQLRRTLHYGNSSDAEIHAGLNQLIAYVESKPRDHLYFRAANLELVSNEFPLDEQYVKFVQNNYNAVVLTEDFNNSAENVTKIANEFVQRKTHGEVKGHFKRNFPEDTKLAIISIAYFNANWAKPFPASGTKKAPFYNLDKSVTQVDMMHIRTTLNVCRISEVDGLVVEIPYRGDARMVMLLADERYGYEESVTWFTEVNLLRCFKNMKSDLYDFYLPKYHFEFELDAKSLLQRMGVKDAFDPKLANFTGISKAPGLFVSSFFNRVRLDVNEGISSKVFPETIVNNHQPVKVLKCDHPFGYGIIDENKRILLGLVVNKL